MLQRSNGKAMAKVTVMAMRLYRSGIRKEGLGFGVVVGSKEAGAT